MSAIPIPFPLLSSPAIATYSFTDIASGTGFVIYSGFSSETQSGMDYHISEDTSLLSNTKGSNETADPTPTIDLDFDTSPFNLLRTLEGVAIVTLGWYLQSDTSGIGEGTVTVRIRKWDGTTETEIASAESGTISVTGGANDSEIVVVPITIPKTLIKKGESLRLSILVSATKESGSGNFTIELGHDPTGRDFGNLAPSSNNEETTKLLFYAPFKIEL